MPLLDIRDLHLRIRSFDGDAHILNGVDLTIERGEVWGLVGETGCGKSLTGLSIARLVATPPARYTAGSICFDGIDVLAAAEAQMQQLRGRRIGMIFQDPTTNLNPVFRIGEQMIDVALHAGGDSGEASNRARRAAARQHAIEMLARVGINEPSARIDQYPHELSGGMRQRVLIAMALLGRPDLLIADEPTTALDVSVQEQILQLLYGLVTEYRLAVLLVTHNLGVVARLSTHVAVMYAGNIVEAGPMADVLGSPRHPYTRALLAAVPNTRIKRGELGSLPGIVPNLITPPPGCRFAPRCELARSQCTERAPAAVRVEPAHRVHCLAVGEGR
jgi:peptide/nickel transport system ATP-binding protein/oligopeptide transport system ATP-binding protein